MVSLGNVLILLAYIIEPCAWLYSMCLKFARKYNNVILYAGYVILDIVVSVIKEFTNISAKIGELTFTLIILAYVTIFISIAFEGKIKKKILHIGVLFLLSFVCDFLALSGFLIFGVSTKTLSTPGIFNSIATLLSKALMLILIRITFKKIDKEFVPIIFLILVLDIPAVVIFQNGNGLFFMVYGICQIAAIGIVAYIKITFNRRKRVEIEIRNQAMEMEDRARKLEEKINTPGTELIEFFENRKKIHINPDSIIYAERVERKIRIATDNGKHEINSTIAKLEELLGTQFIKVNQGTLINKKYIRETEDVTIQLKTGETFHASRKRIKEIKEIL